MITTTISARAVVVGAVFIVVTLSALYAKDAFGSGGGPDAILQGDINCDGEVDVQDALGDLRHVGGLPVEQTEPCPDVGTLAAIPGPQGIPGEQGPQGIPGPQGEAGLSLFANVSIDGVLEDGTAVSASHDSQGLYTVNFAQNVTHCAPVANAGLANDGSVGIRPVLATFVGSVLNTGVTEVKVVIVDWDTGDGLNSEFHLIVAC